MTNRIILLITLSTAVILSCSAPKRFKSDVQTAQKPWTNLNFNNDPNNFQFGIMSDNTGGSRPGIFQDGVKKINLLQPEFVMCVGDLIEGYTTDTALIKREWSQMNGIISGLQMPFFYLPGNHDITNKTMAQEWEKLYGRRYYSFIYKNTLFITLDTNDDEEFNLTEKQTDFVLNALKTNSNVRWTFIFMHHPIWKYNTNGRFTKIENALKSHKYTVIAGHEHHYHQTLRNESNYYILSTTGAGSALRGTFAGEFDHISWVTMNDNGPIIANLKLDGILPHDVSTDKTDKLAKPLLENAKFNHLILCNKSNLFTHGTLYLSFQNPTDVDLDIKLNFFHHHQLQIEKPEITLHLTAGVNQVIEIPLSAIKPLPTDEIDLLRLDWEMKYNHPDYPGFAMHGTFQMPIEPSKTKFINNPFPIFVDKTTIGFVHPYTNLESIIKLPYNEEKRYSKPIEISESADITCYIKNGKDEYSTLESHNFIKTESLPAVEVTDPSPGLKYSYYEGTWQTMPDFMQLNASHEAIAENLLFQNLAKQKNNYAIRYIGFINIAEDNLYQYLIKAEGSCHFYIDNHLIIDDQNKVKGGNLGTVALNKGYHAVRIEYLAAQESSRLRFYTKKNGEDDFTGIESGYFFH